MSKSIHGQNILILTKNVHSVGGSILEGLGLTLFDLDEQSQYSNCAVDNSWCSWKYYSQCKWCKTRGRDSKREGTGKMVYTIL